MHPHETRQDEFTEPESRRDEFTEPESRQDEFTEPESRRDGELTEPETRRQDEFTASESRRDGMDETGTQRELSPAEPQPERMSPADDGSASAETELFDSGEVARLRAEWQEVQSLFVDDPRDAVQRADQLVDTVLRSLTDRKHELENQWHRDDQDSQRETEDLRLALRGYRTFFNRLLTTH